MNVKRYVARTTREALAMARAELGPDAVVLKSRPVADGVELFAMAEDAFDDAGAEAQAPARREPGSAPQPVPRADESMTTVSFETYVRERQLRRQLAEAAAAVVRPDEPRGEPAFAPGAPPRREAHSGPPRSQVAADAGDSMAVRGMMTELRELREFLADRIESVGWFGAVKRRPGQSRLLRIMLQAGFSAALARTIVDRLPAELDDHAALQWLREVLLRNVRADASARSSFDEGGVFALLGPTGVGKTTTAAKIAAQFALKHGAQSVGLITADVYRVGAQDQLRTFGRMLGVPVHVAHDVAALAGFLEISMHRKLVLIDTAGVSQRDERVRELLAALSSPRIRKMVVINAAMQGEAIEEVVQAYRATESAGVIVSKVDEAVQLGGVLDVMIRHRLTLQGIANGQRVPEDWHRPLAAALVDRVVSGAGSTRPSVFSYDEAELAMLAAGARPVAAGAQREAVGV
ncbi:MAG: flagellar biosynthesis protein FlhF [Lautropia sp. SCN 70-15]|nr:MAG: flagellar biosynthesis protein FlhF [Lautropia sp. SCN 70-15]